MLRSQCGVIASWTIVFVLVLAYRILLGQAAEPILTAILVLATSLRFLCCCCCCCCCCCETRPSLGIASPVIDQDQDNQPDPTDLHENEEEGSFSDSEETMNIELLASNDSFAPEQESSECMLASSPPAPRVRLLFLDNVKTFLTFLVVTHHVTCAFGGGGRGAWSLIVGLDGSAAFEIFRTTLVALNQSFFMPCFFFISAYCIPSSYAKRGWESFRQSKRDRLWIPAMFETFVISPLCLAWSEHVAGNDITTYIPYPGVGWFLFWLLLFNWIYASFAETWTTDDTNMSPTTAQRQAALPNTFQRFAWGVGPCGFMLLPFLELLRGSFVSMPISVGSFTCDFLMFYAGLQAKKHGWLESSLASQMDIHPAIFGCMVLGEATGIAVLLPQADQSMWAAISLVIVAGMFCLDMSLLTLLVFQTYLDFETPLTKSLAQAAYGVYLLHPLIVIAMTVMYIAIYNHFSQSDPITFDEADPLGSGGGDYHFVGWLVVLVASNLVVWPLSYGLASLSCLKHIL